MAHRIRLGPASGNFGYFPSKLKLRFQCVFLFHISWLTTVAVTFTFQLDLLSATEVLYCCSGTLGELLWVVHY